ncbi:hypothetical protein [Prosthecobacter sp.]|uniref:putative polyvalent protein kinase domain-containing protein n=1 Tax=Prosthecobacter sp. TaxID=1965333 RepID=UPI002ABA6339|nr:hypothetical protein [Prosthecobacter sp.]MDZ4403943.1 hypothetical protein [Prosthecobacter sp.]
MLREWGLRHGTLFERDTIALSGRRPGMEHEVIFDEPQQRFIKITLPGFYGNTLRLRSGAVGLGPATPLEYLDRWTWSNELFEDDARVLGLVNDSAGPRIAVSQPLVVGTRPEREEITTFMEKLGFQPVRDTHLFFDARRDLLVGDAHPGNFLCNEDGQIFAIDVLPLKATGKLLAFVLGI